MPPTRAEIKNIANEVVDIVVSLGYNCCLFGSAAGFCYGMHNRVPEDIDLVVLTSTEPNNIKTQIVSTNPSKCYLVNSANPQNTYRILWYKLSDSNDSNSARSCKIDILIPGLIGIPHIPADQVVHTPLHPTLPVIPLIALILLKLRGWDDHRMDYRQRMLDKVVLDEGDIEELLKIAVNTSRGSGSGKLTVSSERWMPRWFVKEALDRIEEFVVEKPETKENWLRLGFDVELSTRQS